jgi:glycine/D-amino acid oxidase-like deaminating enzyme
VVDLHEKELGVSTLVAGVNAVNLDEKCMGLYELVQMAPGSKGWRRYQVILVLRGDQVAEMRRDLGPAKSFKADEFRIPGGVYDETTGRIDPLHTVGELYDIAEALRDGRFAKEKPEPTDLIQGYHDEQDKKAKRRRKVSHFGPRLRVQRS